MISSNNINFCIFTNKNKHCIFTNKNKKICRKIIEKFLINVKKYLLFLCKILLVEKSFKKMEYKKALILFLHNFLLFSKDIYFTDDACL